MSEWVKVGDGKPPIHLPVLVYVVEYNETDLTFVETEDLFTAFWDDGGPLTVTDKAGWFLEKPAHLLERCGDEPLEDFKTKVVAWTLLPNLPLTVQRLEQRMLLKQELGGFIG